MSDNNFWRGYFFDLMDRLVQWQKHERHEPLDLLCIDVIKDYDNRCSKEYHQIKLIGTIEDSERDIQSAMSSKHPDDIAFFDEMNDWFDFGIPYQGASYPAFYHTCGPIDVHSNLAAVMSEIKRECGERYPGADIRFGDFGSTSASGGSSTSGGCYIATAVYGSYDCPEVWTLRRFRDEKLLKSLLGRTFVKMYYIVSPIVVEWFGDAEWFNIFWRGQLDKMVAKLKQEGYRDTPYND